MKRFLLIGLAVPTALLAGKSDPGAPLVAADDAFSKAGGNWGAISAFSLNQTEFLTPRRVRALGVETGNNRKFNKAEQAWISCDGTAGVTYGTWQLDRTTIRGWYQTVWARIGDGSYRMLLKHSADSKSRLFSRPGRKGMRAACTGKPFIAIQAPAEGDDFKFGASNDNSLNWTSLVTKQGDVQIVVRIWDGQDFVPVLEDVAHAPIAR
jgi:hypothetical protein